MIYRPDIDGLRAIAVLSVILFHINDSWLPGGFVGVDIFFVLSGYLISLYIDGEILRRRFSLLEFYRRRIKRIAPAMLLVLGVTFLAAQFLLRPQDAELVAESAVWSLASMANVYFWLFEDTSYFAPANNQLPLLHLWSLGVEEQFYLLWPLVLMSVSRLQSKIFFIGVGLITATSFWFGETFYESDPSFVYYMLPSRAGELLVGALVARLVLTKGDLKIHTGWCQVAAIAGATVVIGSLFLISKNAPFPGIQAIPPTVGTALLIFSGHFAQTLPSRALSLRPMVLVGLISYSAYLWHWPLLAFLRYGGFELDAVLSTCVVSFTLLLAWITYALVERPLRRTGSSVLRVLLNQYIAPACVIGALALFAMKTDGYYLRWDAENYRAQINEMRELWRPAYTYDYVCQSQLTTNEQLSSSKCLIGDAQGKEPSAILWGDSNASHYISMLAEFASVSGFAFRNIEVGSCPPLASDPEPFVQSRRLADCRASRDVIWPRLTEYQIILIAADWTSYQSASDRFLPSFYATVDTLVDAGKHVILIGRAPVLPKYDGQCWEKALSFPFLNCDYSDVALDVEIISVNDQLRVKASTSPQISYYDANATLCPLNICAVIDSAGEQIFFNSTHLTLNASRKLGRRIVESAGVPAVMDLRRTQPF